MKFPDLKQLPVGVRVALFAVGLYVFLLSITLLGDGFSGLGGDFARNLLSLTATPVAGLFIGILATSILQSSSSTTSIVVGLVAAGTLDIAHAIPIVMGANIGTTVTGVIVSFSHVTRRQEFGRAFPAAVVHDTFNLLSVMVLLPLEMVAHPLARASGWLATAFRGVGGLTFVSPLKLVTEPVANAASGLVGNVAIIVLLLSLVLLFAALKLMVDMMRSLINRRLSLVVDKYLFGSTTKAFLVGLVFTAIVQSSSATISVAVPLAGAGLLTLRQIFPYAVGANIGTTVTALLAALVTGSPAALQIALAHFCFNIAGAAIWYPLRTIPIRFAEWWGSFCSRHRIVALAYMLVLFFIIPLVVTLLLRRP